MYADELWRTVRWQLFRTERGDGDHFTDEDEECLVPFASQAATVIVNARTYQAELRTRFNLEALVETLLETRSFWACGSSRTKARSSDSTS